MKSVLLSFLCLQAFAIADDDYFPPPDSAGGWRTAKNAEEVRDKAGMDLAKLEREHRPARFYPYGRALQ